MLIDKIRPILIVDDSSVICNAIRGMLQKMGFRADQIDLADTAKVALSCCATKSYQLVLLDFNLGNNGMNGYQLLSVLREENQLPADSLVVVLSADASMETVRSFMELRPDGYLIKPISYKVLSQRLFELLQQREQLGALQCLRRESGLPKLLAHGKSLLKVHGIVAHRARLLMAEACADEGDFAQARQLVSALKSTHWRSQARLLLARIELEQQQHATALQMLRPLHEDPLLCSAALTIEAEVRAEIGQTESALELIGQAIALCPRDVDRYWLQAFIQMAGFDLPAAHETVQQGIRYARYVLQDEVPLQHLQASLCLDSAKLSQPAEQQEYLTRYRQLCKTWQAQRNLPMTEAITSLLQARADIICGDPLEADALVEQHRQLSGSMDKYRLTLVEEIEWKKLIALPKQSSCLSGYYSEIKTDRVWSNRKIFSVTMKSYMEQWQALMPNEGVIAGLAAS